MAVEYVYEIFSKSFMEPGVIDFARRCEKLMRGFNHRPRSADPLFKAQMLAKAEALASESPMKNLILQRLKKLCINDVSYK